MKYLVTGATGFIGGHLARALLARGHQVAAVVRSPNKAQDLAALGVTLYQGDITEKESLRLPMTGVDGVFHVAAWYKVGAKDHSMAHKINVGGTCNVLQMMQEQHIPKGVYTSTLAVFSDTHGQVVDEDFSFLGHHLSEYDRTKWEAHYEVALPEMQSGLPLVIVMPGVVYGPGDTSSMGVALDQYLQRKLPLVPQQTAFAWAHVDDIVEGHILAMEKGASGETYIIAGEVHPFIDALNIAEKITGIPAPRLQPSPGIMRTMAGMMDVVGKIVPLPEAFAGESLRVIAGSTYLGSNAKAKRDLGYHPRSLEDGFREYLPQEMQRLGVQPKT
ncbi:MAG: NAD-dependent epimerase/dehydratase family protein [Chloroflexi bacterium]|nr:NAD-dependent epimerase/dehydratase family protein [Chloroflexota bacterium]